MYMIYWRETDRQTERDRITMFSDWFKVINKIKVLKRSMYWCL